MRRGRPVKPTISIESVMSALKSLDFSAQSPDTQVLENLLLIDYRLKSAARPSAEDIRGWMLRQIITEFITKALNQHRRYFDLQVASPNQSREIALRQLEQDFHTDSEHLKGWSLLYLRYVRPELSFSVQELENLTHTTSRTLQRYQEKAVWYLRDLLIDAEWEVRKSQQSVYLRSNIPEQIVPLIGRDNEFKSILSCFQEDLLHPVLISGAQGVGKSALAASVVDYLIKQQELDYLLWIQQPQDISFIPNKIWDTVLPYSTQEHWCDSLEYQRLALIIDGADALDYTSEEWSELLRDLRRAYVIIICADKPVFRQAAQHIELQDLSQIDREQLIATYTNWNKDQIEAVAREIGGNPRQLMRATQTLSVNPAKMPTLTEYYDSTFAAFSPPEQVLQVFLIINREALAEDIVRFVLQDEVTSYETSTKFTVSYYEYIQNRYYVDEQLQELTKTYISLICETSKHDTFFLNMIAVEWLQLSTDRVQQLLEHIDLRKIPLGDVQRWLYFFDRHFGLEEQLPEQKPYLSYLCGVALRRTHAHIRAQTHLQKLVELFGLTGQFELQIYTLFELGLLKQAQGILGEAKEIYEHMMQLLNTYALPELLEEVSLQLARIAISRQNGEAALSHLEGSNTKANKVFVLFCEAHFLLTNFDFLFASVSPYLQQRDVPDNIRASLHTILGRSYQQRARYSEAVIQFNEALTLTERDSNQFDIARARNNLSTSYLMTLEEQPRELLKELETLLTETRQIQAEIKDTLGYEASTRNLRVLKQHMLKHR